MRVAGERGGRKVARVAVGLEAVAVYGGEAEIEIRAVPTRRTRNGSPLGRLLGAIGSSVRLARALMS